MNYSHIDFNSFEDKHNLSKFLKGINFTKNNKKYFKDEILYIYGYLYKKFIEMDLRCRRNIKLRILASIGHYK